MKARLAAFYFVYYGGVAIQMAFLPSYMLARGLSARELGTAQLFHSTLAALTAFAWGQAADRAKHPSSILRRTTLIAAVLTSLLLLVPNAFWLMLTWSALGIVGLGVIPLVDSITTAETRHNAHWPYGRVRMFGSIGYIATGQLLGWWLTLRGDRADDILVMQMLGAGTLTCAAITLTLSWSPTSPAAGEPRAPSEPASGLQGYRQLFADSRFRLLMLVAALHWAANGVYHLYFGAFVRERGGGSAITATALMVGVVVEIATFAGAASVRRLFSIRQALALAFIAGMIRWTLTPLAPDFTTIIALQALHGITFGLFWITVQRALGEWIPTSLLSRGQAAFAAIVFGLSHGVGSFVFGHLHDATAGYGAVFAAAALFELIATVLLISRGLATTTPAQ